MTTKITWPRVALTTLAALCYVGAAYLPDASAGLHTLAGGLLGLLLPQVGGGGGGRRA